MLSVCLFISVAARSSPRPCAPMHSAAFLLSPHLALPWSCVADVTTGRCWAGTGFSGAPGGSRLWWPIGLPVFIPGRPVRRRCWQAGDLRESFAKTGRGRGWEEAVWWLQKAWLGRRDR